MIEPVIADVPVLDFGLGDTIHLLRNHGHFAFAGSLVVFALAYSYLWAYRGRHTRRNELALTSASALALAFPLATTSLASGVVGMVFAGVAVAVNAGANASGTVIEAAQIGWRGSRRVVGSGCSPAIALRRMNDNVFVSCQV